MSSCQKKRILDWSAKQARILSGNGVAEIVFNEFQKEELPHHYLENDGWFLHAVDQQQKCKPPKFTLGAFERPLFYGGWEWTTDDRCLNVQTSSVFVDIRKPADFDQILFNEKDEKIYLRLLARQHAFAGFTAWTADHVATRHHLVDWNWLGKSGRKVPNKWRAEANEIQNEWKELSYARLLNGSPYYFEHWRRVAAPTPRLAIVNPQKRAFFCLSGNRFAYAVDLRTKRSQFTSCAAAVDAALDCGDYESARDYVYGLQAGFGFFDHSVITSPYIYDSLQPEHIGKPLFDILSGFDLPVLSTTLLQQSSLSLHHGPLLAHTCLLDNHVVVGDIFGKEDTFLFEFVFI